MKKYIASFEESQERAKYVDNLRRRYTIVGISRVWGSICYKLSQALRKLLGARLRYDFRQNRVAEVANLRGLAIWC